MAVTVTQGTRRVRVPYEPGTLLARVRAAACTVLGADPLAHGLRSGRRDLDLTLPYRLANLAPNATLELVAIPAAAAAPAPVRIKLRGAAGDSVHSFSPAATVAEVLAAAGLDPQRHVALLSDAPVDGADSLALLGARGAVVFTVRPAAPAAVPAAVPAPAAAAAPAPGASNTAPDAAAGTATGGAAPAPAPAPVPGAAPAAAAAAELGHKAETPPDMSPAQFRTYYTHLHNQAAPRPMLSKDTQARLARERREQLESIAIRVRLPDQSLLEGTFAPRETGAHVYDFVRQHLRDSTAKFTLETVQPNRVLRAEDVLIEDAGFGARVLVVYIGPAPGKAPFLSDRALALRKATDGAAAGAKGDAAPAAAAEAKPDAKPGKPGKGKPKWLKSLMK